MAKVRVSAVGKPNSVRAQKSSGQILIRIENKKGKSVGDLGYKK